MLWAEEQNAYSNIFSLTWGQFLLRLQMEINRKQGSSVEKNNAQNIFRTLTLRLQFQFSSGRTSDRPWSTQTHGLWWFGLFLQLSPRSSRRSSEVGMTGQGEGGKARTFLLQPWQLYEVVQNPGSGTGVFLGRNSDSSVSSPSRLSSRTRPCNSSSPFRTSCVPRSLQLYLLPCLNI
jgi:hypothetical protein